MIFRLFPGTLVFNAVLCHHSSPPKSVIIDGIFIISYSPTPKKIELCFLLCALNGRDHSLWQIKMIISTMLLIRS